MSGFSVELRGRAAQLDLPPEIAAEIRVPGMRIGG